MGGKEGIAHRVGVGLVMVWGVVMLWFFTSGRLDRYLTDDGFFREQAFVAGVLLLVLGLFNWFTRNADVGCGHAHGEGGDHDACGHGCGHEGHEGHGHSHSHGCEGHHHEEDSVVSDHGEDEGHHHHAYFGGETFMACMIAAMVLAVPLVAAAVLTPDRYDATLLENKGLYADREVDASGANRHTLRKEGEAVVADGASSGDTLPTLSKFTLADLEAQTSRNAQGDFELTVPELYYVTPDIEVREVIHGQPVETVGQVMPERLNNPNGTRLRVFRLFVECCVADARPISVTVEFGKTPPEFRELSWIKIRGTMQYQFENGKTVPVLMANEAEETEEPMDAMMY